LPIKTKTVAAGCLALRTSSKQPEDTEVDLRHREQALMSAGPMHAHEAPIDDSLVRELLAAQFPHWADLPLKRVTSSGTVNALYRLGDDMAVRLPASGGCR